MSNPSMLSVTPEASLYAQEMMKFIDQSPSPFHAVESAERLLKAEGYESLNERNVWSLEPNGQYYVKRGGGSLIAFRLGSNDPVTHGVRLVGAHTDSPNIRLKPHLAKSAHKHLLLDVEPYGGLLVATWSDRDLGLAGRVIIDEEGLHRSRLIRVDQAVCRIPNLAIHLNRTVNEEGLKLNKHTHLNPVAGSWDRADSASEFFLAWLAEKVKCDPEQLIGHDLGLFDIQRGAFSGVDEVFLQTGRLDNLASSYHGLTSLLEQTGDRPHVRLLSLFDHEEVGSQSARGANSTFLGDVLVRIAGGGAESLTRMIQSSHQVSADMAHAVHPNYADKHDGTHQPRMNMGPVIKNNVNTRYATNGETAALFRTVCKELKVPYQEFVNRPDLACGSTIGSLTAARLGLRTVDVGNPMWAMHSAREMAGTADQVLMHKALSHFYSR